MKKKLVIFDMDGTILDTMEDLQDAANATTDHFGYPRAGRKAVRLGLGNGARFLVKSILPEGTAEAEIDRVLDFYALYYKEHSQIKTRPYAGIPELLRALRQAGVLTAVVSNKPDLAVQSLCKHFFSGLFDFSCGERQGIRRKPFPDSVNEVLTKLQIAREDAVYVGDSEVDFQTGLNARMDSVIVDWGFRTEAELRAAGARIIVSSAAELAGFLGVNL